jgi:hypothetical protein
MSYYDNKESVANIYVGLVERGWKCYGYKADESDSMTDYWSPARWEGIAEKNGFVLLVDVYGTSQSGYKKTKQGYTPDYEKISKLKATINDKASSENEKESSQKIIDSMLNKQKESTNIIEEYPTFSQGNPKGCNWHIEKDGNIIAKGKGAYQCDGYLFGNYREETMKKVNAFIDKIESKIAGNEQLEPVQEKIITKVIKPIETPVNVNDFIKDQTIIKLNSNFTGGHYKGELLQLIEVHTYNNKTLYTFVKLGKKYQQLKRYGAANNTLMLDVKNIEKWITEGTILTMELGEVEEITYKTVFKKVNRKGQESNLLQGETTEKNETIENNQTVVNTDNITVGLIHNEEKNGLELKFNGIPSEGTRALLKENGYKWSKYNKVWYIKHSETALMFAEGFVSAYNEPIENESIEPETITNEVETLTENNSNFVNDPYNQEIKQTVNGYYCHMKAWNMEPEQIESRLNALKIPFSEAGEKYFFQGITYEQLQLVKEINKENEAILFDNSFDCEHVQNNTNPEPVTEETTYETTYNQDGKIKVKSIQFLWSESGYIQDKTIVNTFSEAEQLIHNAALNAPNDGSYDKTKIQVTWSDGFSYTARIDIQCKHSATIKPLQTHIMKFAKSVINDDGSFHNEEERNNYKQFIDTYSLTDDKQEPTPNNHNSKGKVLDFNSKFKQRQEENERQQALNYFTDNILPYLSYDDKLRLLEAQENKEKFNTIMYELMLKSKAERLKQK